MIAKLPANVELDDLIQVGMIGLSDALTRYEVAQGVQFETFATQRIRGAMLDELRESDWMSRSSRKSQKDIEKAVQRLEQKLGRSPLESEIAAVLELTAQMAFLTLQLNPQIPVMPAHLLDKHFLRKHGPGAYYGQS